MIRIFARFYRDKNCVKCSGGSSFKGEGSSNGTRESRSASRNREIHPAGGTPSLSATFDSGNNLVSPMGVLVRMPVGNALARIRKLPGVTRETTKLLTPLS